MAYNPTASRFDFNFDQARPYRAGDILLGYDWQGEKVGFTAESHCIGVAGTGGGKTTAVMIPNILETSDNVFCIDPTGAISAAVCEARKAKGQRVYVLDPLGAADVPDEFRSSYNPLRWIDRSPAKVNGEINAIMHAMMLRADPRSEHWDSGGQTLLAAVAGHLLCVAKDEFQTLSQVRWLLTDPEGIDGIVSEMAKNEAFGGMIRAGASVMKTHPSEAGHFRSAALNNTHWINDDAISEVMADGPFDLRELKTGKIDVFLVLPVGSMDQSGRWLRLMTALALRAMLGTKGPSRCLFLLDEFFALGKLEIVLKAFAAGRSAGIRCFPFVQDMGQLELNYGKAGMRSFFANSSLQMFFAVDDGETLRHISDRLGDITVEDLGRQPHQARAPEIPYHLLSRASSNPVPPHMMPTMGPKGQPNGLAELINGISHAGYAARAQDAAAARQQVDMLSKIHAAEEATRKAEYDHVMRQVGRKRMPPDEVKRAIGKPSPNEVARSMIVFAAGGQVFNVRPWRYDLPPPVNLRLERERLERELHERRYANAYQRLGLLIKNQAKMQAVLPEERRKLRRWSIGLGSLGLVAGTPISMFLQNGIVDAFCHPCGLSPLGHKVISAVVSDQYLAFTAILMTALGVAAARRFIGLPVRDALAILEKDASEAMAYMEKNPLPRKVDPDDPDGRKHAEREISKARAMLPESEEQLNSYMRASFARTRGKTCVP